MYKKIASILRKKIVLFSCFLRIVLFYRKDCPACMPNTDTEKFPRRLPMKNFFGMCVYILAMVKILTP